jgi:hypothetical protein
VSLERLGRFSDEFVMLGVDVMVVNGMAVSGIAASGRAASGMASKTRRV